MIWIVIGSIALLGALVAVAVGYNCSYDDDKVAAYIAAVVFALATVAMFIGGSVTTVSANHVGVMTKFGAYQGVLQSGFHWKSPLVSTEEIPTRAQLLSLTDTGIKFSGNSGGNADVLVGWKVAKDDEASIRKLWETYKTRDEIEDKLVKKAGVNGANQVTAQYEPGKGVNGATLPEINAKAKDAIDRLLDGSGVIAEIVNVSEVNPDAESQKRINLQVGAEANRSRALIDKETARTEAETAEIRNRTQTPASLQYRCLEIAAGWDQQRQGNMPLIWSCLGSADAENVNLNAGR